MSGCYSILECYNLFSGAKMSIKSFCFIILLTVNTKLIGQVKAKVSITQNKLRRGEIKPESLVSVIVILIMK